MLRFGVRRLARNGSRQINLGWPALVTRLVWTAIVLLVTGGALYTWPALGIVLGVVAGGWFFVCLAIGWIRGSTARVAARDRRTADERFNRMLATGRVR
jgi:hypothetical protein